MLKKYKRKLRRNRRPDGNLRAFHQLGSHWWPYQEAITTTHYHEQRLARNISHAESSRAWSGEWQPDPNHADPLHWIATSATITLAFVFEEERPILKTVIFPG